MKIDLANGAEITPLLRNGKWREVAHFALICRSEGWGSATLLQLDKAITASPQIALLYLLERYVIDDEGWEASGHLDLDGTQFLRFVLSEGYISDAKGWDFPETEFWTQFTRIRAGMREAPAFQLHKNGQSIPDQALLQQEDIIAVHCFADVWNECQYLIETKTHWAFFNWGTSA